MCDDYSERLYNRGVDMQDLRITLDTLERLQSYGYIKMITCLPVIVEVKKIRDKCYKE